MADLLHILLLFLLLFPSSFLNCGAAPKPDNILWEEDIQWLGEEGESVARFKVGDKAFVGNHYFIFTEALESCYCWTDPIRLKSHPENPVLCFCVYVFKPPVSDKSEEVRKAVFENPPCDPAEDFLQWEPGPMECRTSVVRHFWLRREK